MSELNGIGTVYLVPLGKPQTVLLTDLLSYYRGNYGLHLHLLAPVRLPAWTMDGTRHQLIAEELVEAMKRANPQLANDPDVILVGVTDEDMYISEMNWNYAFSWRQEERFAIVSTARLDPVIDQKPANPTRLETRTRKMITKDIGLLYYRLQPRDEFSSALYDAIGGVEDLDNMGEHFLISDTQARGERRLREQDGDPCFTIRHYYASEKNRTDAGMLGGCSGASKQLNLEIMEVDLRYGLFLDRRTEIYIPDRIPLEFTRVLRMQDSRSRAFGVGGTHNLNIFPVGDTWPFTWMDLILADGGRVHYKRSNWGVGYWDATYSETAAGSGEFSGSRVSWNWPGWKLEQPGGTSYYFPDGRHLQRPEQAALLGVEDGQGNRLNLPRDEVGGLIRAHSPNGSELTFDYDEQSRITQVRERNGIPIDYGYDSRGCLAHVKDADARVTDYSHDAKNRMITVAQNGNLILRNEYDAADRIIRQTLPGGRMYTFRYWLGHAGQVVAVEVNDSAGLAWQIKMSDGARYTLQTIRSH